ncbi:MAG TPA: energy-coupling factor transporter transmembrane component T [Aquella sp.]|nr:energy-coupling factor transporter transmembrane component T [Aquella sp.]
MKNNILNHEAVVSNRYCIVHPMGFLVLPILYIIAIFSANNVWQYLTILGIAYANLLLMVRTVKYRILIIFILCFIPVLLAIYISSYLFTNGDSIAKINMADFLTGRYFSLGLVSFAYSIHTPFSSTFNYLIERKILPVKIGYAILAAFNSFHFLAQEFGRIQISYKMRYGKNCYSPVILIALLTTAARYAHNLSIGMYSRGISKHKTFVFSSPKIRYFDYILWMVNLAAILCSHVII